MKKIFIFFILVFNLTFAQGETSVFGEQNDTLSEKIQNLNQNDQRVYENIAPSDESTDFEKNEKDPFIPQSSLVLTNEDYPNKFYVGEVFCIIINAKTTENTDFDFLVSVDKNNELDFLNPNPIWEKNNDSYTSTLWFVAKTSNASLNQISVKLSRNKEIFQEAHININPIKFENITANKNYSHIVASSLEVKKLKAGIFDDKNIIMMLELNATNANLKNFYIQGIKKQGIENLKGDLNASSGFYYAILPSYQNNFNFSYFNKDEKKIENFNLNFQVSDDEISTQSDLNPVNKQLNIYKQYALWALTLIFALIFIFKKNYIILALGVVCFALGFLVDTKTQNAILKANSKAQILPTQQSTYFYSNTKAENVEILGKRLNYVKVLFQNGKIGWVQSEDLQKN